MIYVSLSGMNEEKNKEQTNENEHIYELGFHIVPTLTEDEAEKAVNFLREQIVAFGGSLITEGTMELIDLAYTMSINEGGKHSYYDRAYFGWIKFEMNSEKLPLFKEDVLDIDKNLIRYILIKTVREETRAQLKEETLKTLDEVKTKDIIAQKPVKEKTKEPISDEDIDKVVDELLAEEATETKEK